MIKTYAFRFLHYMFRSRFFRHYMRESSFESRVALLLELWRSTNTGLNEVQRYQLISMVYDKRFLSNYSLILSSDMGRTYGFFDLIERIQSIPGDVVECGVGRGISLAYLVYGVAFFKLSKTVYGFDSFAGFPAADEKDLGSRVKKAKVSPGGWEDTSPALVEAVFTHDRQNVDSLLNEYNVPVKLFAGFFDETLANNLPQQIALLHADADMYDSTIEILKHSLPRMVPGGVIIFDEYHDERWPGAKRAADELCFSWGLSIEYFPHNRRYGVKIPLHFTGQPLKQVLI